MSLWKKTMDYLGLGPDDAYDDYDDDYEPVPAPRPARGRDNSISTRQSATCGS